MLIADKKVKIAVSGDILIVDIQGKGGGVIVLAPVKGAVEGHLITEDCSQESHVHTLGIRRDHGPDLGDARDHVHSPRLGKGHVHSVRGLVQVLKIESSHVPIARAGKDHIPRRGLKEHLVQDLKKSLETKGDCFDFSFPIIIMHDWKSSGMEWKMRRTKSHE